jgi:glycerol-3-phosphate acyltransferase PlsY
VASFKSVMENIFKLLIFGFLPAYLLGSIPFGFIAGRIRGIDIRQHGSGNIGATNVWRVLGKKWGIPTFTLDFLKVPVAALIVKFIQPDVLHQTLGSLFILVGGVLGHNYPICLKFKGGKGIATSAGGLLWLLPIPFAIVVVVWGIVFGISRYVSLASVLSAAALPLAVLIFERGEWAVFWFCLALSIMAIWRHRINIQRLREGTEYAWKNSRP